MLILRALTLAPPKIRLTPQVAGQLYLADTGIPPEPYERIGLEFESPFGSGYWVPLQMRRQAGRERAPV